MTHDCNDGKIGQRQVYSYLESLGIEFDYYEHPEAPTIEIASRFYRGEGTTLCKNLFFRNHKGNRHYLVIMDSHHEMDIHSMERSFIKASCHSHQPSV